MSFSNDIALEVNQLPISIEFPKEPERFYEILSLWQKRVSVAVNTKEGSLYTLMELGNFKQFYSRLTTQQFRNVYRYCWDIVAQNGGVIAGGATVTFAHGITGLLETAHMEAACTSSTPTYFTVVYPYFYLDAANVNFTNPLGATTLTACTGIAEYLKN